MGWGDLRKSSCLGHLLFVCHEVLLPIIEPLRVVLKLQVVVYGLRERFLFIFNLLDGNWFGRVSNAFLMIFKSFDYIPVHLLPLRLRYHLDLLHLLNLCFLMHLSL